MIHIQTPRLILREHRTGDLDALYAMLSDPRTTYYLPSMRKDSMNDVRAYLDGCIADAEAIPRLRYNLAVADGSDSLAGSVGLHLIDGAPEDAHYALGFFIRPDLWNLGYAAEAVGAALGYIFDCGAVRVSASALAENLASRRVLEKRGFAQEGLLVKHTRHDGEWKDCAIYRLLKDEYEKG